MDGTKKRWQKPELTVLVRSKPEEAVLSTCKTNVVPSYGPRQAQQDAAQRCWDSVNQNCQGGRNT